ncbi:MAG: ATP-binding cassette domain-containing protein [Planctomycetaceae bacterium]|nr:ATP-binding cassette domain-containing protein [Planctomycetaceae bacterium]
MPCFSLLIFNFPVFVEQRENSVILETERLTMQFRGVSVLREINLQLRRGETLAVIGESGCGKTVLLKTLIGLLPPTSGRVLFDGTPLSEMSDGELAKQRTRYGFVFQQAALFDSMTIAENVAFPLRQHTKRSAPEIMDTVIRLLTEVGLPEMVLEKKPAELSGGMRKRVGFARALAMDPELMLYDEPTTGLDPIMSDVINELIINTRRRHNVSGVIVTHDMKSAKKVADRIVMLYPVARLRPDEPQIVYEGPADEIDNSPDSRVTQFIEGEAGGRLMEMCQVYKYPFVQVDPVTDDNK